jgi:branched-chain amino acid transport system ATP-binding protein
VLTVRNIETCYGPIRALSGVSLDVRERQIVAILGPNGAGKTTILKTICGLLEGQPEKGTIDFMGTRLNGLKPEEIARLGIRYVPESRAIFEELTVRENLVMGGYLSRDPGSRRRDQAEVERYFPFLRERADQLAGALSGGEQRMLAIGLALMAHPRLMLLDEPSLGLGPLVVRRIFEIIEAINKAGTTILLVEQNAGMALRVAHYGYLLDGGRVALSGEAGALLEHPQVRELYLGMGLEPAGSGVARGRRRRRWQ